MLTITISRKSAFLIALAIVLAVPMAALAGSVFNDVDDTNTHIDGITFMKDSGVSVGCDANNNYCPDDPVSRAQMATFMYRLSGNDPATPPSVDAATLGGLTADDFAKAGAGSPGDADTLDGLDSTDFLLSTGKAADADLLDGLDSTAFLGATDQAADADLLDGLDSTAFLGATDQATDSDKVDGLDAVEITSGVAVTEATGTLIGTANTNGTVLSVSADAPADGFLIITASADVSNVSGDDLFDCSIYVDGLEVASSIRMIELDGTGAFNREEDCSTTAVVPVTASTTYVADLRFDSITSATTAINERVIWALFVPTDIATP